MLETSELTRVGDYLIDQHGVIQGHVHASDEFRVTDRQSAEWVLEKLSGHEARIKALELQKAAIIANIDSQIADETNGKAWLQVRFGGQLKEWAKAQLTGKSKTVKLNFGRLSFRKVGPKVVITDKDQALFWCREHAPEAVFTLEEINRPALKKHLPEIPSGFGMVVEPEYEKFSWDTGVDG